MMKTMEKRQEAKKNQEKTLKRMMAYQKKAEQMISRKRMNDKRKNQKHQNQDQSCDRRRLMTEAEPYVSCKGAVLCPDFFPVLIGGLKQFPFVFHCICVLFLL